MSNTFYIRTYGCQMNQRDSEAVACLLEERGLRQIDNEETADIILFNTCSVRDQAERKVFGKVGLLKKLKRKRPEIVIGVMGCMAQNYGAAILERCPHVDLVVGTDQLHNIPEILENVLDGNRGVVHTQVGTEVMGQLNGHKPGRMSAYVSVMRGCNQFCTYCIVPYVRGREKSRPIDEIVAEVRRLVAQGTREIVLLGQNVTAYGLAEARKEGCYTPEISPFADLLRAVNDVPGVVRIRFTSPHQKFMNQAFIDAVCDLPKVCKSFHLPLQSGSNRVLKQMKRGYTVESYLSCFRQIKDRLADVTFSTDIIVGFPGETEEDFQATKRVMEEVGYDMAYIFKYSPRTGTVAEKTMPDDVPKAVKQERNQILLATLDEGVCRSNTQYVGRDLEVMVEGPSKRNPERWTGRSDNNKVCIFEILPELKPGDLVKVHIERTTSHSLFGCVCQ